MSRGAPARAGVRLAGLAVVYLPLALLLGAGARAEQTRKSCWSMLGAPLLAALTLALFGGYRALGVASALTVSPTRSTSSPARR